MITASRRDGFEDITRADGLKGAALVLVCALLIVGLGIALDRSLGDNALSDALIFSSWLFAMGVAAPTSFLKPYSDTARRVMTGFVLGTAFLVFLAVLVFAQR